MGKIAIVMPAYNEGGIISKVLQQVRNVLDDERADIIVVDDGSEDTTASESERKGVIVLPHSVNMGYGCAVQTGLTYAWQKGYETVVLMDADGQHSPDSIPALISHLREHECDMVLGSRFKGEIEYQMPFFRRLGQKFFSYLLWLMTGIRVTDPTSGFQAIRRHVLRLYISELFPGDYPDANFLLMLHRAGFKLCEVGAKFIPRQSGKSMHSNPLGVIYYILRVTMSMIMTLLREKPRSFNSRGGSK